MDRNSSMKKMLATARPAFKLGSMRFRIASLALVMVLIAVAVLVFVNPIKAQVNTWRAAPANTAVTTYKYNNSRNGWNPNETILNTSNVNSTQFGRRAAHILDGQVYAEPLFMPNLTINGAQHNVAFAETENDSIYAFDADATGTAGQLWHTSFLVNGATIVTDADVSCGDINPIYGITDTPVIDPATNLMYLVVNTKENNNIIYRLHALDIRTGRDAITPVVVSASFSGINFDARHQMERPGLLLLNGVLYTAWGSHCDNTPYSGWIIAYNPATLQKLGVFNTAPTGLRGAIWQAGDGLAADANGNIYFAVGNGSFDVNTGGHSYGDSYVKVSLVAGKFQVLDYLTPFNQSCLNAADTDLGSGGPLLLPNQNELIGVGKEGRVYVVNRDNMGHYHTISNPCGNLGRTDVDQVIQELAPQTVKGGVWGSESYWNGPNGECIYTVGTKDHLQAWKLNSGKIVTPSASHSFETFTYPGGNSTVSSNGSAPDTGIVWTIDPAHVLRAYDAANVGRELYNSNQIPSRDVMTTYAKFSVPSVANGEVFVGTGKSLVIFGLLGITAPNGYNNIGISADTNVMAANFDGSYNSYSSQALANAGISPGKVITFNGVTFTWPNVPTAVVDNYWAVGQTLNVTPVSNATRLAFLGSASNGPLSGTATIHFTDGTTQTFTLGLSDWTLNGGRSSPSFGNLKAITTLYRNTPTGKVTVNTYVFYTDVALTPGKTVQSVTLPPSAAQGMLHVFAVGTK